MTTTTLVLLFVIVALYILEPEFFGLIPEWCGLWRKQLNLWYARTTFKWQLKRQIAKDKAEYEKFTREFQDQNGKRTEDHL